MFQKLLKSKLHRASITRSDLDYEGSIAIDECLPDAADIRPFEAVHVWSINNNETRLTHFNLVTCYPFRFVGHAPQRFIVRAERNSIPHA
jgi:aspartate 1-decarboxylase